MFKRNRKFGFTLLELLIVVIIVSILASVALPQFGKMTRRAKASEAINTLGSIFTAESLYYQENGDKFTADTAALSLLLVDYDTTKFAYAITGGGGGVGPLVMTATGSGTASGIVVTGTLVNTGNRTITSN